MNIADNVTGSPQLVTLTGSGPNFSIGASPTSLTVSPGSTGTSTVTLTPQAKFNQPITLSCSGLPGTVSCGYSPNPVSMPGGSAQTSTLTVTVPSGTAAGTYTITIAGTYATLTNLTTLTLTVP